MWKLERTVPILRLSVAFLAMAAGFSCVAQGKPTGQAGRGGQSLSDGGGTFGAEDSSACASFQCPVLECGTGMRAVPLPGECCPTLCEPSDCSTLDCPALDCASGTHAVKPSGACCSTCVKNPPATAGETCDQGQAGYADFYDQTMSALGAAFCAVDSDCKIVVFDNPCSHGCGTAVAFRSATDLTARLTAYAAAHCGACAQTSPGCPPVEQFPYCTGGVCSAH